MPDYEGLLSSGLLPGVDDASSPYREAAFGAVATTPDKAAKVADIANKLGVPRTLVNGDETTAQTEADYNDLRVREQRIKETDPALYAFLSAPDNMAVARDDIDSLSSFSGYLQSIKDGWNQSEAADDLSDLRFIEVSGGTLTDAQRARVTRLRAEMAELGRSMPEGRIARIPVEGAKMLPFMREALEGAGVGAVTGAVIGGAVGAVATRGAGAGAGASLGARIGGGAGAAIATFRLESGLAYDEFIDLADEHGNPVDPEAARAAAMIVGAANAGLEMASLGVLTKLARPATHAFTSPVVKRLLTQRLGESTARRVMRDVGLKYAEAVVTEGVTESVQEATAVAGAAVLTGQVEEGAGQRILAAGEAAALATIGLGGLSVGPNVVVERMKSRVDSTVQTLNTIDALARETKLGKRDRAAFNQLAREAVGEDAAVFLDSKNLAAFVAENPAAVTDVLDKVGISTEKLLTDAAGGIDTQIRLADWVSAIQGTEYHAALVPFAKSDPALPSQATISEEQKQFEVDLEERQAATAERVAEREAARTQLAEERGLIEADVFAQIMATGRFDETYAKSAAKLFAAGLTTGAAREGASAFDTFKNLEITSEGREASQFDQPGTPAFDAWFGDSAVVDEAGAPIVVYHGGEAGIEAFDTSRVTQRGRGDQAGTYFTADRVAAGGYAARSGRSRAVYSAYLSLQNPLDITDAIAEGQREGLSFGDAKRRALEVLDRDVHDGIVFRGDRLNPAEYVAFNPEQIKSVDNRGTFDPNDPRILFQPALEPRPETVAASELDDIKRAYTDRGVRIHTFQNKAGDVILNDLVVPREERSTGVGSDFMQDLTDWADRHGTRLRLTPGTRDSATGTTSRRRLVKFYKRFGFAENKGRSKDFTLNAGEMVRLPVRRFDQPAFHGTPHPHFDAFTLSKIGTGEGAQAYGWGLYFASDESVARYYREALGRRFLDKDGADDERELASKPGHVVEVDIPDSDQLLDYDKPLSEQPEDVRRKIREDRNLWVLQSYLAAISFDTESAAHSAAKRMGLSTYEVLPSTSRPGAFKVMAPFPEVSERTGLVRTGRDLYENLANSHDSPRGLPLREKQQFASKQLLAAGIPGLRYLDGSSRRKGEGSHNFVIWDEQSIRILQRLEQPGAPNAPRGGISFQGSGRSLINLSRAADMSTLLHEGWHLFLENTREIVEQGASGDVLEDWNTIKEWYESHAQQLFDWVVAHKEDPSLVARFGQGAIDAALAYGPQYFAVRAREGDITSHEGAAGVAATAMHEMFAEAGERYLETGKAPSKSLQDAFRRFRIWLTAIYRRLRDGGARLDPAIVGVMDRMLATDEEMALIDQQLHFEVTANLDMSDEARARYTDAVRRARDEAVEEMNVRAVKEAKRRRADAWKAERDALIEEFAGRLAEQPVRKAEAFLKAGGEGMGQLSLKLLREMFPGKPFNGRTVAQALTGGRNGVYQRSGGAHPQQVAALFGLTPGELVQGLAGIRPIAEVAAREADKVMRERHGSLDDAVARDADLIAHSTESREEALRLELQALREMKANPQAVAARRNVAAEGPGAAAERDAAVAAAEEALQAAVGGPNEQAAVVALDAARAARDEARTQREVAGIRARSERSVERAVREQADRIKAAARAVVDRTPLSQLQPGKFRAAEARAGRAERAALRDFALEKAEEAMIQRILNYHAYRFAIEAKRDERRHVAYLKNQTRTPAQKRFALAGRDYRAQINAILSKYDLRLSISGRRAENARSLLDLAAELLREGRLLDVPLNPAILQEGKSYKLLTIKELEDVRATVQSIAHAASQENKLLAADREATVEEARQIVAEAVELAGVRRIHPLGKKHEVGQGLSGIHAIHTKMEWLFEWLDGGAKQGPIWNLFYEPMSRASERKSQITRDIGQKLRAIYEEHYTRLEMAQWAWGFEEIKFEGLDTREPLTKDQRLAIALNWGNQGNRDAVTDSLGWNEAQVQLVLDTLDERDWKFVRAVWDLIGSLRDESFDLHERMTGVRPTAVEGATVTTKFGSFLGGYYPIKYNPLSNEAIRKAEAKADAEGLFGGSYASKYTAKGHLEERKKHGGVGKEMFFDLSLIDRHFDQVIHDLAFREAVSDTWRLLNDDAISKTLKETAGVEAYKQLNNWLQHIAANGRSPASENSRILKHLHSGTSIMAMGWKLGTAVKQLFGYSWAATRISRPYLLRSIAEFYGQGVLNPLRSERTMTEMRDFARERSLFMQTRSATFDRDIRQARERVGKRALLRDVEESFFFFISAFQTAVDVPTWMAAYSQAMDGNVSEFAAGDEAAAIRHADQAVRLTQSTGRQIDLAEIQARGGLWNIFTMFYSAFSAQYNMMMDAAGQQKMGLTDRAVHIMQPKTIANLFFLLMLPAILEEMVMSEDLGPEPDDDIQNPFLWAAVRTLSQASAGVIGLRDLVSAMDRGWGYEITPIGSAVVQLQRAAVDVYSGDADVDMWKGFTYLTGYGLKVPTRAMWQYGEAFALWAGGTDITLHDVIFGVPKEKK